MASRTISAQVNGNRNVPELWTNDGNWNLDLNNWNGDWNSDNRFLAVRNNYRFSGSSRKGAAVIGFLNFSSITRII